MLLPLPLTLILMLMYLTQLKRGKIKEKIPQEMMKKHQKKKLKVSLIMISVF